MMATYSGSRRSILFVAGLLSLAPLALGHGRLTVLNLSRDHYGRLKLSGNGTRALFYMADRSVRISSREGEGFRVLHPGPVGNFDIDYSGEWVCAELVYSNGTADIIVVNTSSLETTLIAHTAGASGAAISGDGGTVLFRTAASQPPGYYVRPSDNSLPAEPFPEDTLFADINFDGTRFAYTKGANGLLQVWGAVHLGPSLWEFHQITHEVGGAGFLMRMSGDGSRVVYRAGNQLKSVDWEGTATATLYSDPSEIVPVGLSYDGSLVNFRAYTADRLFQPFVARTDGSRVTEVRGLPGMVGPLSSMDAFGTTVLFGVLDPQGSGFVTILLREGPLAVVGNPVPGGTVTLSVLYPEDARERYAVGASYSTSPGFQLPDGRTVPLTRDSLTEATLGPSGRPFRDFRGRLDSEGVGTATIRFPASAIPETRFYVAAVTVTGFGLPSVDHISQPVGITVLPPLPQQPR